MKLCPLNSFHIVLNFRPVWHISKIKSGGTKECRNFHFDPGGWPDGSSQLLHNFWPYPLLHKTTKIKTLFVFSQLP